MITDHSVALTFDSTVAFDIIVAFIISLVVLLTSTPVMWRERSL
jgi:hypothetical protein